MSWRPNGVDAVRNPDLDRFRDSAAEVVDDAGEVIAILVFEVEPEWALVRGHLWWRQWSAGVEVVNGYWTPTHAGEAADDWGSDPRDEVSQHFLHDLRAGRYVERNYDEATRPITCEYKIKWLDDPERTEAPGSAASRRTDP